MSERLSAHRYPEGSTTMSKLFPVERESDPIWNEIRRETELSIRDEPLLASFLHAVVLRHDTLEESLSLHLAQKLGSSTLGEIVLNEILREGLVSSPSIGRSRSVYQA